MKILIKKGLRTLGKIVGRLLLGVFLAVYVVVALVNYSVVQSYVGMVAGHYFSKEWGGEVRIGSLHAMPFDHLLLDNVLMVSPEGDTILQAETLRVRFKRFPYSDNKLELNSVYLRNAYYHLESYGKEINLRYIINHYKKDSVPHREHEPFTVEVKNVVLNRVHYKMDLPDVRTVVFDEGVQIPHMEFFDIRCKVKNLRVVNDDVTCRVVRMSAMEKSGFKVKDISGDVHVGRQDITTTNIEVETEHSRILVDSRLTYDGWEVMKDYVTTVNHEVVVKEGTTVAMSDVAYWAPVLWGVNAQIEATCSASGPVNHLQVEHLSAHWGQESGLSLRGELWGLPNVDTSYADVDIERLWTTASDVVALGIVGNEQHPAPSAMLHLRVPQKILNGVEYVDISANARGGMNRPMRVNLNMASGLGNLRADGHVEPKQGYTKIGLEANSDGLGMSLIGSDWITHSGFSVSADGTVGDMSDWRSLTAKVEGVLTNSVVKGQRLSMATLTASVDRGRIVADVESTDDLAAFTAHADVNMDDSLHTYIADVDVRQLNLGLFAGGGNQQGDTTGSRVLQTSVSLIAEGNSVEEIRGEVVANYTRIGDVAIDNLRLQVVSYSEGQSAYGKDYKRITVESDMADAVVSGRFRYDDLPLMVGYLCQEIIPNEFNPMQPVDEEALGRLADRTMAFNVKWNDSRRMLPVMVPGLSLAPNTRIDGNYNYGEKLKVAMRSDSLRMGSVVLENVGMSGRSAEGKYLVEIESQNILAGAMEIFDKAHLSVGSNSEQMTLGLAWGDADAPTRGDLLLRLHNHKVDVLKPTFYIADDPWQLGIDDLTLSVEDGLSLRGSGISIESSRQQLNAQVSLCGLENDYVEVRLNHFKLDKVLDILLQDSPLTVAGDIGGRCSLYGITSTPYFNANLTIGDCEVNHHPMGDVSLRSNWNAELNILNLHAGSRFVTASGWVGLGQDDPDMNVNAYFDGFDLSTLEPTVASFASLLEGKLYGDIDISGSLADPLVVGEAYVDSGRVGVGITNVVYSFADTVRFTSNRIRVNDFRVSDPLGNQLVLDGDVRYKSLDDITLGLRFSTDNIMVLNQHSGDQFYGTLFAGANGTIRGNPQRLSIGVQAHTNSGCNLTVPVSDMRQVEAQNYIVFVDDATATVGTTSRATTSQGALNLTLDLSLTPDLQLNLPMDFSEVSANMSANGNGEIHLTYDGVNVPQVLGNYEISSGTMKVGLISLIEKNFTIENGSSLNFQGSLPDARFDLRAIYAQRVNLSTLTGSLSSIDNTQKYIQVEDVIAIAGTLQDPSISFDIRLPNADQSVSDEVFSYIDRNSERDMLNQTISLLLRGSFYNANAGAGSGLIDNGISSGYAMVGSLVGGMVGDMVQFVDVDIDYKAATELTNEQVDFNISKDWGRWYLESTLGYGGDSRELSSSATSSTVIDALVGYRLSPLVHLYAYNRTNTNDYTRMDLPYKQGAGLKLTKEFDTWSDLFKSKKRTAKR